MPLASVSYPGNGSTLDWTVPFGYISRDHVTATINGVGTSFTWMSPTTIRISPAVPNGSTVGIRRTTPKTPLVDFADGNNMFEVPLDTLALQVVYLSQEQQDAVDSLVLGGVTSLAGTAVTVVPSGNLSSTNAQAALYELDADKVQPGVAFTGSLLGPAMGLSYSFGVDTNTGFGRVAADAVSTFANGVETVRVTENAQRVFGSLFINQVGTSTSWSMFCDASVLYFRSDDAAANVASLSESGAFNAVGGINDNGRRAFSASSMYQSAQTTVTTSFWHVWSHGLAGRPVDYKVVLQCVTPEAGYAVGDEIDVTCGGSNVDYYFTEVNATEIAWCLPRFLIAPSRTTASSVINLTPANWRVVARAWY